MRKIEQEMNRAIRNRTEWSKDNTRVYLNEDNMLVVKLHGNTIAFETTQGWYINLCNWNTVTTRSRLNALSEVIGNLQYSVFSKDFQAYVKIGQRIDPLDGLSYFVG